MMHGQKNIKLYKIQTPGNYPKESTQQK